MKTIKNEITAEIVAGNMSLEELAKEYGIDYEVAASLTLQVNSLLHDQSVSEEDFVDACHAIDLQYN